MGISQNITLKTPYKNRIAYVHCVGEDAFYLLVHPCGELLIVSNQCDGSTRWDGACILWHEKRQEYWMCKHGIHDPKFSLALFDEEQLAELAVNFGIDFRRKDGGFFRTPNALESLSARSLQAWSSRHPGMSKESPIVEAYVNTVLKSGFPPVADDEYTGR
jgi:hypothetical protein